jgi:AhpD family alkylhydroperoxidase
MSPFFPEIVAMTTTSELTMTTPFPDHTPATADPRAARILAGTSKQFGFLPAAMARMAESPAVTESFVKLLAAFDDSSLGPAEREVLAMTVGTDVGCHVCVALHSAALARGGAEAALIEALRSGAPLPDARLQALRQFVRDTMTSGGGVSDAQLARFQAAGFSPRQALDVVLGIATYTLSTHANRMTRAPLDAPFEAFRWTGPAAHEQH